MTLRRLIPILLLAGLLPAGVGMSHAEGGDGSGAVSTDSLRTLIMEAKAASGDTITVAEADSILALANLPDPTEDEDPRDQNPTESRGIHPAFKSETKVLDKRVDLTNDMSFRDAYPSTWAVGGRIYYNRSLPRELTRESLDTGFSMNTGKQLLGKLPLSLNADRSFKREEQNKGEANYRLAETSSDRMTLNLGGGRQFTSWLGANMKTTAGASEQNNQGNQGLTRTAHTINRALAGHVDLTPIEGFKLVAGYSGSLVDTDSRLNKLRGDIRSSQDSLQLKVEYRKGTKLTLSLQGGRLEKLSESLDFERNVHNFVDDSTKVVFDETRELGVGGRFNMELKPWKALELSGNFSTSQDSRHMKVTEGRDKDTERTALELKSRLRPWGGQVTDVSYKDQETRTDDYSADKTIIAKEFFVKTVQDLSETFQVSGEAFFSLSQNLYADGKQDRDKYQTRLSGTVAGAPTPWLLANSTVQWFEDHDLLIPAANSVASKDKNTLSWKSELNYTFFGKYELMQRYGVSATEEDFYFTADKNALNTEYTLVTASMVPLGGKIVLDFEHEFRRRESGSFLPDETHPDRPKTFYRDSRKKTENLKLGLSYGYREYLSVSCRPHIGRDVNYSYQTGKTKVSPFGTLEFSVKFNRKLGDTGNLAASLNHRSRFGSFVRENQKSLWLPTLSIGYTF